MSMRADVAIVGGGPIGLATARAAAEAGADTVVFEKRPEGSTPSCCTGLVSTRTLATLGVSTGCVLREIRAISVHLPSGRTLSLRSNAVKAFAICRTSLEAELLDNAREAGADVRFATHVTGAESGKLHVSKDLADDTITVPVVVGADGPRSQVARWFSLKPSPQLMAAAQAELSCSPEASDQVDVFVGQDVAPGFFAWSVPAEEGIVRVGVGVLPPHNPSTFLHRLLAKHFPRASIQTQSAGWIPLTPAHRSATAGALLVGDAAGHVKPLSGGGLYTGGACAQIAGETAACIAQSGTDAPDLLAAYVRRCLEVIGKEQAFGQGLRQHLARLHDTDIDAAATTLDDPCFLQFLADHADIDHLHRLPDLLASEPSLWTTLLRLIPLLGRPGG